MLQGDIPDSIEEVEDPSVNWIGHKIPLLMWKQIMSFFIKHKANEACIYLLYHEVEGITLYVPKQEVSSASVNIDHTKETELMELLKDRTLMGNIHTHPGFGAFASGTDKKHEEMSDGVYITIGKVTDKIAEYHIRTVIKGCYYDDCPNLMDLIEIPDLTAFMQDDKSQATFAELLLMYTGKPVDYPEEWDAKFVKPKIEPWGPCKTAQREFFDPDDWRNYYDRRAEDPKDPFFFDENPSTTDGKKRKKKRTKYEQRAIAYGLYDD